MYEAEFLMVNENAQYVMTLLDSRGVSPLLLA